MELNFKSVDFNHPIWILFSSGTTGKPKAMIHNFDNLVEHYKGKKEKNINIYLKQQLYPTLTLFVSKDNEYIAYTKEGFFSSSKNGAKYIGYHINQGVDKEARYVSVDKLYDTFYRPDLVAKALQGKSLEKYAKNIDINQLLSSGLAPMVSVTSTSDGNSQSNKRDINLELQVCQIDNGGYDNLTLYLNGMAIDVISKDRALRLRKKHKTRKYVVVKGKRDERSVLVIWRDKKNQQSYDQPSKEKIQETQAADNLDKDLNSLDDLENDDELGDIDKDLDNFKLD